MTIAAAQAPAAPAAPAPLPVIAPSLVPAHFVDLMTAERLAAFRAQWKTMEAKIVEGLALAERRGRVQDIVSAVDLVDFAFKTADMDRPAGRFVAHATQMRPAAAGRVGIQPA